MSHLRIFAAFAVWLLLGLALLAPATNAQRVVVVTKTPAPVHAPTPPPVVGPPIAAQPPKPAATRHVVVAAPPAPKVVAAAPAPAPGAAAAAAAAAVAAAATPLAPVAPGTPAAASVAPALAAAAAASTLRPTLVLPPSAALSTNALLPPSPTTAAAAAASASASASAAAQVEDDGARESESHLVRASIIVIGSLVASIVLCGVGVLVLNKCIRKENDDDDYPLAKRVTGTFNRTFRSSQRRSTVYPAGAAGAGPYKQFKDDAPSMSATTRPQLAGLAMPTYATYDTMGDRHQGPPGYGTSRPPAPPPSSSPGGGAYANYSMAPPRSSPLPYTSLPPSPGLYSPGGHSAAMAYSGPPGTVAVSQPWQPQGSQAWQPPQGSQPWEHQQGTRAWQPQGSQPWHPPGSQY
ncbi:hypothetical protein HDU89_000125 [Geranomyces variabilis]|nr:hypothetical protein HDU89_000125 [Geranomyces variabilis]